MKWLQALLKGFGTADGNNSGGDARIEAKLPVASVHSLSGNSNIDLNSHVRMYVCVPSND